MAYNYTDDGWIYGSEYWQEVGINASHMAGPHHVCSKAITLLMPTATTLTATPSI